MTIELPEDQRWRLEAACTGMSTYNFDHFFPVAKVSFVLTELYAAAKAVCARCPVTQECLDESYRTFSTDGVWGGMTPEERGHRVGQGAGFTRMAEASGIHPPAPSYEWRKVPDEPDLYDYTFSAEELAATAANRRRRTEILARVDAELDALDALEAAS